MTTTPATPAQQLSLVAQLPPADRAGADDVQADEAPRAQGRRSGTPRRSTRRGSSAGSWQLDARTRTVGLAGVARAREVLAAARRATTPDEPLAA